MTEKVKETKIPIPTPKVIMLSSGQQVIAGVTIQEGSKFIRLHEPYKVRIHENLVGETIGFVEEKMSLTPLVFQTTDKIYSVLREHIITIGSPNQNLSEYYNNVRLVMVLGILDCVVPLLHLVCVVLQQVLLRHT